MSAPAPPSDDAHPAGRPPLGRGDRYRRTLGWAYGVSALLHVRLLVLYPRLFGTLPDTRMPGASEAETQLQGIELLNLVEVAADAAVLEPEPEEPETERQPIPVEPAPRLLQPPAETPAAAPATPAEDAGSSRTAAERLQPSTNDERLWQPIPDEIVALSPEQRAENLLHGRLQALNDSAALAAARAARMTDWTYTDGDGNRWGISPGKLHLGPVTLPLPFGFGAPVGASDDLLRGLAQDAEIRRAAGQLGVDESLEQRNEEIRRRAEERRRARPDTSGVRRR